LEYVDETKLSNTQHTTKYSKLKLLLSNTYKFIENTYIHTLHYIKYLQNAEILILRQVVDTATSVLYSTVYTVYVVSDCAYCRRLKHGQGTD
jgi:hypothetical protein